MAKEMLINVSEGEECRIALVEDGRLEELYMERASSTSHVGNIYKGRVTNVEASIQAAFVDFGLGRNGFLHISDLMPTYFGRKGEDIQESVGRKMARRDRPPIQRCLRRGDEIIVQIIKEGIGTKGPTLSSYLSIPGRILVMMPGMANKGVSKKIEDDEERRRLRQILDGLEPPKDVGFIIRTAGIGKTKAEIQRDFTYLSRLWMQIEKKQESGPGPMELYTEGDLVSRTVRDVYSPDVDTIVVDNKEVAKRVKEVIKLANPRAKNKVDLYEEPIPLFHKYDIEKDIEMMHSRHVPLPGGGSLVIDSTEAVVAIDVNSGKLRDHADAETTAFKTDMEAAEEIPRQLRLRNLGGVIICDFIDLRYERHRRELEQKLHDKFKNDRSKTKVLRMSDFGIIEITRSRSGPSLKRSIYSDCPHCKGAGLVKTSESMSLDVMRHLAIAAHDERVVRVELSVHPEAGYYLQNRKRMALANLEHATGKPITVKSDPTLALDETKLELYDGRDGRVYLSELGMTPEVATQNPRRHIQGGGRGKGGRQGGRDNRPVRGQPTKGRPRDVEPAEDLDRVEDQVEEREEDREDETLHPPVIPAPMAPRGARPPRMERQDSYSNFTDNDVDLGDEEEELPQRAERPPQGARPQEPRRDQQGQRHDPRRDQGRNQGRDQGRRQDGRNDQRNAPRHDQRNDQRGDQRNGQRNDSRRDSRGGQQQGNQRPPQGQPQRPPQGRPPVQPAARADEIEDQIEGQPEGTEDLKFDLQGQLPTQGQPANGGPQGGERQGGDGQGGDGQGGDGGRRRRRRRRGGRGRNRNRNREFNEDGSPNPNYRPPSDFPADQNAAGERPMGADSEADEEGEFSDAESAEHDSFDAPRDRIEESAATASDESPAMIQEETREHVPTMEPALAASLFQEIPEAEHDDRDASAEIAEEAAPESKTTKSRGRRKPAAPAKKPSRSKKPSAAETAKEKAPAKSKASRGKKKEPAETKRAAVVAEAPAVVRTGSSDRHHLIVEESDEEPHVPSPAAPRPRTYRDLDEIPDDLD